MDTNNPVDKLPPSHDEPREDKTEVRGGKTIGVCNIKAELLKAGGVAIIRGLHVVLATQWHSQGRL